MWITFPDTNRKPLEEIAALFGDGDEVAVFENQIGYNTQCHEIKIEKDSK